MILRNLGIRAEEKGELPAALDYHSAATELAALLLPETKHHADCLQDLGTLERDTGRSGEAAEHLLQALRIRERLQPGTPALANTLTALGLLSKNLGDLDQAVVYLQRALEIAQGSGNSDLHVVSALNNLSLSTGDLGEWEVAESYARQAITILSTDLKEPLILAIVLTNLAIACENQGRLSEALSHYRRSLELKQQYGAARPSIAATLRNLGVLHHRLAKPSAAQRYLHRALEIEESLHSESIETAATLDMLGGVYGETGDLDEALRTLRRASNVVDAVAPQSITAVDILSNYGVMLERHGDRQLALRAFQKALGALDSLAHRVSASHEVSARFLASNRAPYFNAISLWLLDGATEVAFDLAESWRGRSLLVQLLERDVLEQRAIPERLETALSEGARVLDRLAVASTLGSSDRGVEDRRPSDEVTEILVWERANLQAERRRRASDAGELLGRGEGTPGARLSAIEQHTQLLSYVAAPDNTHIFWSQPGGFLRTQTLPVGGKALRQRVERFRELIAEARPGTTVGDLKLAELRRLGKELYNLLLAPAAEQIENAERVLIVADGPLHYLPFAALTREVVGEDGLRRDQYLAEWKPFHFVLSAAVFAELKKDRRDPAKQDDGMALQLVAFGDPQFPASVTGKEPDRIADIRVRSAARRGTLELAPLPYSRREVDGIAALFPPDRVQTFLGSEATEEKAKAIGKGARILHFATHARLDDRFPLNSSLLLTMPEGFPEDRENGLLQVWEIFEKVRLDADLVVLSACESGLGEEQGGEGLIGLTRAFQYAGARTVVASLWEVRDEATAELMIRFYRHLTSGKPKDQALQAAQRELLAGPIEIPGEDGKTTLFDATAPYYWAAFQVIGDWK